MEDPLDLVNLESSNTEINNNNDLFKAIMKMNVAMEWAILH